MSHKSIVLVASPFAKQTDEKSSQKTLREKIQQMPNGNSVCIQFLDTEHQFHHGKAFNGKQVLAVVFVDVPGHKKEKILESIQKNHSQIKTIFHSFDEFKENSHTVLDA